jgi:hypothetical protein
MGSESGHIAKATLCLGQGCLLGQKLPVEPKEIWSLRIRLQFTERWVIGALSSMHESKTIAPRV